MRLIGAFEEKKRGLQFYSFLQAEKIDSVFEVYSQKEGLIQIWVVNEDDLEKAIHWFQEFQKDYDDPRFIVQLSDGEGVLESKKEEGALSFPSRYPPLEGQIKSKAPLTRLIIFLCILFYLWNHSQHLSMGHQKNETSSQEVLTPLVLELSYDAPLQKGGMEKTPLWEGLYSIALKKLKSEKVTWDAPLFVNIRKGEVWRLFTPVFLHLNFTHIFFNMLSLSILGAQIEARMKRWHYLFFTLSVGAISNTFQYLMSGPFFMGYSGIVCALAGFIWMRKRVAPSEGYPFREGMLNGLGVFILGMALLQSILFFFPRFSLFYFPIQVANTAHLSGAVTGLILGRTSLFSKDKG